jgi:hypothetical protein
MRQPVSHLVPFAEFALAREFYFYGWIHVVGFLARKQFPFYNPEMVQGNLFSHFALWTRKQHELQSGFIA